MSIARILGYKGMMSTLTNFVEKYPDEVAKAMYQEANIEVVEMKKRCPVDTREHAPHPGNLRASIHAELPEREGKMIKCTIATGKQAPYAIYVHEDPDAFHPIGEWKFIENPLKESAPYMANRIAARINLGNKKQDGPGAKAVKQGGGGEAGEGGED